MIPYPILGIDIDGTITENPVFFQVLTNNWPGIVVIITYRDNLNSIIEFLNDNFIKYDKIIISQFDKSKAITENDIDVYFDDQDEMIKNIDSKVTVLKIRNEGNFDYNNKKWLYSKDTGKLL